jgi:hypothetical protein
MTNPDSSFAEMLGLAAAVRLDTLRRAGEASAYVCECNDPGCRRFVYLTADEYDEARAREGLVLAPGHRLLTAAELNRTSAAA